MKLTKRKGFNFFRSYYDVYNELENDKDKVAFIDALLDRQFLGIKPQNLKGMAKFAYISQVNSIDSQVKGYEDKTGCTLGLNTPPTVGGRQGGSQGGSVPPTVQVEEKGKGKEKEKLSVHTHDEILMFEKFQQWAKTNTPSLNRMKAPLTIDEYLKLKNKFPPKVLTDVMFAMENKPNLVKNYKSTYRTINTWCNMRTDTQQSNSSPLTIDNLKIS